jgi:tetratricopeptide (TPR) repeat protein
VLALIAGATQVPGLVSTERTRASEAALAGNPGQALDLANQAVTAEPWAGSPYAARALAYERLRQLRPARAAAEDAIGHDPNNWRNYLLLARVEAELGNRPAVLAQIRQIHRLAPRTLFLNPFSPYSQQLEALTGRPAGR